MPPLHLWQDSVSGTMQQFIAEVTTTIEGLQGVGAIVHIISLLNDLS